jgi:hypothetical protein
VNRRVCGNTSPSPTRQCQHWTLQVDLRAFAHLLAFACPRVASHLEDLQVDIPSATSAWFLVAFLSSLPTESTFRLWDVLFFERSPIMIFRSALALFDIYSHALMETKESGDAYALLQAMAPMTCDASTLVDSASIAYGHIGEAALRVLRDRYSPEVLEAMRVRQTTCSTLTVASSRSSSRRKRFLSVCGGAFPYTMLKGGAASVSKYQISRTRYTF